MGKQQAVFGAPGGKIGKVAHFDGRAEGEPAGGIGIASDDDERRAGGADIGGAPGVTGKLGRGDGGKERVRSGVAEFEGQGGGGGTELTGGFEFQPRAQWRGERGAGPFAGGRGTGGRIERAPGRGRGEWDGGG